MYITPAEAEEAEQKEQVPQPPLLERPPVRRAIAAVLAVSSVVTIAFIAYYIKVAHEVDQRLAEGPFSDSIDIYCAPRRIAPGAAFSVEELAGYLRRSGFT